MSDSNETVKILSFADGSKTVVRGNSALNVSIEIDDMPLPTEEVIEVTQAEADDLLPKLTVNEIDFDTMKENATMMKNTNVAPTEKNEVI